MLTPAYCTLILATAQALKCTLEAVPAEVLQSTDCTMLATEGLLLLLPAAACLQPGPSSPSSSQSFSQIVSSGQLFEQLLPPGCSPAGLQQLQSSLDALCDAAGVLLKGCASALMPHLVSAVMLALLPVIQSIGSGRSSTLAIIACMPACHCARRAGMLTHLQLGLVAPISAML